MSQPDFGRPANSGPWPDRPPGRDPGYPDPDDRTDPYEELHNAETVPGDAGPWNAPHDPDAPEDWPGYGRYTPGPEDQSPWGNPPAAGANPPPPYVSQDRRRSRKRPVLITALLVAIFAAGAGAVLLRNGAIHLSPASNPPATATSVPGVKTATGQAGNGGSRAATAPPAITKTEGRMTDRYALARETAASAAQYILLGGFASVAAGISAQGLTGFARSNMGLRGLWPYLLFFALDGAAGVCAVLLARRAARNDGGLAPRLAVWGLVAASGSFNFTHAPRRPAAPQAYALMPVVAAVLFEFCLREMKIRRTGRADRKLSGLRWLHPAERVRVQAHLAAHEQASAGEATRRVQIEQAARRLYQLRLALRAHDRPGPRSLVAALPAAWK